MVQSRCNSRFAAPYIGKWIKWGSVEGKTQELLYTMTLYEATAICVIEPWIIYIVGDVSYLGQR